MPLVNVEQYLRDDGKLEVRVHNCSGSRQSNSHRGDYTTNASEVKDDLVFQSGSQDDEQPCAVIFSLRASHPHLFYYCGAADPGLTPAARSYLNTAPASNEEERASILAASAKEWGANGFSSVAPAASAPGPAYSATRVFDDGSGAALSTNNSAVFASHEHSHGTLGGPASAASDRGLLVREAIPDGVLLPGERRTFVLDLDDPQYLRDFFKARVEARERETRRTHHHHQAQPARPPSKPSASRQVDASLQTPVKRRATVAPKSADGTPAPHEPPVTTPDGGVSDRCSSSFEPAGLERATTMAFGAENAPTPRHPTQRPLGSPGLLDSRRPPNRYAAARQSHGNGGDDSEDEDELTSSAVPYSRMTIQVESEPATSPAGGSQRQSRGSVGGGLRPSAPPVGDDESSPDRHSAGARDASEAMMYPTDDPPPTISSRLKAEQQKQAATSAYKDNDSASLEWSGSLRDTSLSNSSSLRQLDGRNGHSDPGTSNTNNNNNNRSDRNGGQSSSAATATGTAAASAALTTPPPMLYVYYSRLGDENKCVEKARKWLKREEKSYAVWQDTYIKGVVKLEKKREAMQSLHGGGDTNSSLNPTRSNSANTVGSPANLYTRLLPPALGDPVRWRRSTGASADHGSANAFSNVSIARSRAAYSRYFGAVIQEEVGSAKAAATINERTIPYAATHTNAVSKEAQKMFNESRVGDGVVVQPLRWQLFVPRHSHHPHPLISPRGGGVTDPQLTSPNSTSWRGGDSPQRARLPPQEQQQQQQQEARAEAWPSQSEDTSSRATTPRVARAGEATVPLPASLTTSAGGSERRFSPGDGGPLRCSPASSVRAGRGLALLDDSVAGSTVFDGMDPDSPPTPESRAWSGSRGVVVEVPNHSRGISGSSTPPPQFEATRSFLPPVGVDSTRPLDLSSSDDPSSPIPSGVGVTVPRTAILSDDLPMSEQSQSQSHSHSEFLGSPLIAFNNASKAPKDNTLWGSLMSTGSAYSRNQASPLGPDDLILSPGAPAHSPFLTGTSPNLGPRVMPGTLPAVNLESSLRSQGPPASPTSATAAASPAAAAAEPGLVNASFSRLNTLLQSYIDSSRDKNAAAGNDRGLPQSDLYPTEDGPEVSAAPLPASAVAPGATTESSGVMSPLEDSTFAMSSQTGMRPLTMAPPASLMKRASPLNHPVPTPRRGQAYLEKKAMEGGALGAIALTASLVVQVLIVFGYRLHEIVAPIATQVVSILAEQTPGLVSSLWNFLVDVVLADDNVKVMQKVMVPLLGVMGLWLVGAMVWTSGGAFGESDFDGPL